MRKHSLARGLSSVVAVFLAVGACQGANEPTGRPAARPASVLTTTVDGLTLTAELDRLQVAPGGSVTAHVVLHNDRPTPVEFGGGCEPVSWVVKVQVPTEPEGRAWPGIGGEFKQYALGQGTRPGGVPALQPLETSPRVEGCRMSGSAQMPAGETRDWSLVWPALIIDGVSALPGEVPFSISIGYDPELSGHFLIYEQLTVAGRLMIVGEGRRALTAGEALDVLLADARFSTWLAERPARTWSGANLFLQGSPGRQGIVPAGPSWEVDLFREIGVPRHWAIAFVHPFTSQLALNFCDIPCDR